jgi:hypothetical protein
MCYHSKNHTVKKKLSFVSKIISPQRLALHFINRHLKKVLVDAMVLTGTALGTTVVI